MDYTTWEYNLGRNDANEAIFAHTDIKVSEVAAMATQGETYGVMFSKYPFLNPYDIRFAVQYTNKLEKFNK